jgi:valyl-tRNA synthetase
MATYKLVWDDFCAWYLEMIKPGYQHPIDGKTLEATRRFFEAILGLLQPFTPFVAEELWHLIRERAEGDDCVISKWPEIQIAAEEAETLLKEFALAEEVVTNIRNIRKNNNIANKVRMDLLVKKNGVLNPLFDAVIVKMGNLSKLEYITDKVGNSNSFLVNGNEYFVPFGENVDVEGEKEKMEEELEYTKRFLKSVQGKLQNQKFVQNAPDSVVDLERKKEADALNKIAILEDKLSSLN